MTLTRRVPKFGFTNINRVEYQEVNVATLQRLVDEQQITNGVVDKDTLLSLGVIRKRSAPVKILGNGDLSAKLSVSCDKISESAKNKIESAGGAVTVHG
jgi:large subunit ribosomal protein L15